MHLPRPLVRIAQLPLAQGAALFLLATAVFIPAMSGDFIWDDDITLTSNALVKLPFTEGLKNIWFSKLPTDYYPVTWSTFWIEWRLFESNPAGYHVINILLHSLSSLLTWRILLRLNLPGGAATAWCAALLFAIHPVAVDSVAWISQRKNTLSMVFYMASILAYLKFDDSKRGRLYWLSLLAYAAAFLSKSSVVALPLVLICLLFYRHGDRFLKSLTHGIFPFDSHAWRRGMRRRHELVRLLPFFTLAALSAYLTIWFQGKVLGYGLSSGNDRSAIVSRAIKSSLQGDTNLGERILVAGQTYWFYIGKLLFPRNVAMVYAKWDVNAAHIAHYLPVLLMIGAIAAAFIFRARIGRGLCTALVYVAASLLPILGLVKMSYQGYSWVANHLCYIAIPGVTAFIAGVAAHLLLRLPPPAMKPASVAVGAVLFGLFGFQTWTRSGYYQAPEKLWRDNISKIPRAHAPYNELGIVLIKQKRYAEAVPPLEESIRINPTFDKPHNNLGTALSYLGKEEEAIAAFRRALHYNSNDPDALGNLGLMLVRAGKPEEALPIFQRSIRVRPMSPTTYLNMGIAFRDLGRDEEARATLERAVAMNPTGHLFRKALGLHYYNTRNYAAALEQLLLALGYGSNSTAVMNSAAWIMATNTDSSLRDGPRAFELITRANTVAGVRDVGLLHTTAAALAELGRFDEAINTLREAAGLLRQENGTPSDFERIEAEIRQLQQGRPIREGEPAEAPPPP